MDAVDHPPRLPPMWRRMALVMSLAVLIVLAAACWTAVRALTAQVDQDDVARMRGLAAELVPVFRGRLQMADSWVRYLAVLESGGDAGSSEQLLRRRALDSGTLSGVVLVPWNDAATGSGVLDRFAPADRLALNAGRSVLTVLPDERNHAGVYLAHLVRVAGSQRVGFFELAPAWLWRDFNRVPDGRILAVVDTRGDVVFADPQLAPDVARLFALAPIDPRNPARPVLQGWQQGGTARRAAVAQMQLDAAPVAGDSVWNIAIYDQAVHSGPALLSLAPVMLALLLLGIACVLLGTCYLSRRWQPALTQLHAALDGLRAGAFIAVEAPRAAGAPAILVQTYNRAAAELQRRFTAQEHFAEIDRLLLQAEELEQALEPILVRVRDLCGAQSAAVALVDRDAAAHARSFLVSADSAHCPISRVNIDEEVEQQLREAPQGLTVPVHHLERYGFLEPLRELGAKSCCAWPVMVGERIAAILSVAYVEAPPPPPPPPAQLGRGAECAARLQTALVNAERAESLYRQAHFDSLTALPNRLLFHDRLSQELKNAADNDQRSALLYIDLDHFKKVNDSVGHVAGDQLLTIVAQRLRACVKEGDTVARLGGDEFTVILRNLPSPDAAGTIAERIIEALQRPVNIAGRDHFVRASIGITLFPDDANTIEAVMRNADMAMYHAKDGGRARAMFFDSTMARALAPVAQSGLFRALRRREFALHYQPQFDLRTGEVAAVEALLRWQSPRDGVRLPHDFIAAAEESGLIVDIGTWVLESGCHQLAIWRDDGVRSVRLTLNVSLQQLRLADFAGMVRRCLERASLPPGALELEVTEMAFTEEAARQTLRALADLGVRLALDDFGTGYSSLSHLRQHPVDVIKIDGSLVQEVPDNHQVASLTATLIDMAHALGKQVVAEGVETLPQLNFLREHGCERAQGYVLARPLGVAEVTELLGARQGMDLLLQRAAG